MDNYVPCSYRGSVEIQLKTIFVFLLICKSRWNDIEIFICCLGANLKTTRKLKTLTNQYPMSLSFQFFHYLGKWFLSNLVMYKDGALHVCVWDFQIMRANTKMEILRLDALKESVLHNRGTLGSHGDYIAFILTPFFTCQIHIFLPFFPVNIFVSLFFGARGANKITWF